jgi:hypothetical protein
VADGGKAEGRNRENNPTAAKESLLFIVLVSIPH